MLCPELQPGLWGLFVFLREPGFTFSDLRLVGNSLGNADSLVPSVVYSVSSPAPYGNGTRGSGTRNLPTPCRKFGKKPPDIGVRFSSRCEADFPRTGRPGNDMQQNQTTTIYGGQGLFFTLHIGFYLTDRPKFRRVSLTAGSNGPQAGKNSRGAPCQPLKTTSIHIPTWPRRR
jgi:hypothetical protein